ncbi:hypothetical protein BDU57DRAFT_461892, partial [Ampelomyces quisqualis]
VVRVVVERGYKKLSKYYIRIDNKRGFLFNYIIVLNLFLKLTIYKVFIIFLYYTLLLIYLRIIYRTPLTNLNTIPNS